MLPINLLPFSREGRFDVLRTNLIVKQIVAVIPALVLGIGLGWTLAAQDAKPEKKWKDQAEYDAYVAVTKADAKARVPLLDKWKAGYAQSEYSEQRQDIYLITYLQLNQCRGAVDTSVDILKTRPNHARSIEVILACVYTFMPPQPADLDTRQ